METAIIGSKTDQDRRDWRRMYNRVTAASPGVEFYIMLDTKAARTAAAHLHIGGWVTVDGLYTDCVCVTRTEKQREV